MSGRGKDFWLLNFESQFFTLWPHSLVMDRQGRNRTCDLLFGGCPLYYCTTKTLSCAQKNLLQKIQKDKTQATIRVYLSYLHNQEVKIGKNMLAPLPFSNKNKTKNY